ncbi:MAG: hypothetical protein Q4C55_04605 [Eubacterium sp.]|nr:hypothetical protein [Eubacterium sp.]
MSLETRLDYSNIQLYRIGDTEIENLVFKALKYNISTIVVGPSAMNIVYNTLRSGENLNVNVAVSYPSGAYTSEAKIQEIEGLLELGNKIDGFYIPMQVGLYLSGYKEEAFCELKALVKAAKGIPVKIITEIGVMSDKQIKEVCEMAIAAGADSLVTSAGFSPYDVPGPSEAQYKMLVQAADGQIQIIANEDNLTKEQAENILKLGVDRICTPKAVNFL